MRKPVVVVSAAVALLLAGGVVTTSVATADSPGSPGWTRSWWPSLFGAESPRSSDAAFPDRAAPERLTLDYSERLRRQHLDPIHQKHADRVVRPQAAGRPQAAELPRAAVRPRAVERPQAAARGRAAGLPPAVDRPRAARLPKAAQRAAARPQPVRAGQRPAGTTVRAAGRRAVTGQDVAAGLHAPVQQRVLALINQNRRRGGCAPITLDRRLIKAANGHASDMARRRYFEHHSPRGKDAGDRVRDTGYRWSRYGENIARGADSPSEVVNGWMNSPPHRRNIMDCRLREMGVGLAISRDRTPYWVQDFATPQS